MIGNILVVDDEQDMLTLLQRIIEENTDHQVVVEPDPLKALERIRAQAFNLVITDLKMPGLDGIKMLEKAKIINPNTAVVVMTAYGSIDTAVEATRKGAHDFITKPFRRERILVTIEKVMEWQAVLGENEVLRQALTDKGGFGTMLGVSPAMKDVFARIQQVAPTEGTVLVTGASGTGKELVARAIHHHSARKKKKLVTINCTTIPENVMESELFGHVKGAFTGAWKDKKGLVEAAHGGTLFLDEIGDLKQPMQTKLLRLLQNGEYKPVGSEVVRNTDIRFVAATNHDLQSDIRDKFFREDLFYRLNVINFHMPLLKERREDIALLTQHFLKKYAAINRKDIRQVAPDAMQALLRYDFPGNVRELQNIIERGVIYSQSEMLMLSDLGITQGPTDFMEGPDQDVLNLPFKKAKDKIVALFHRRYIQSLLSSNRGNVSKAAGKAGIQRQYLHRLMKETGIDSNEYKE